MSDPDDTDMLAAEYVLGTLDPAERGEVDARRVDDGELDAAVRAWEDRLSPLLDAVTDVAPPADAYIGIASRLFDRAPAAVPNEGFAQDQEGQEEPDASIAALRRRVRRWRGAAGGFALLAAALLAWIAVRSNTPEGQRFAAVLQRDAGAPVMLVDVDLASRKLTVRPLAAVAPAGRAYELWMINPSLGAPRSLGLVPAGGAGDALRPFDAAVITGATYAVTVEPPGGSPTGQPTTAPVLSGRLAPVPF